MNHVTLIGNLTAKPELEKVGQYDKANFTVAYNDPFVKDKEKAVYFFTCEMWGKAAETFVKWHNKGDRVCVFGKVAQDRWEKDGQKRSIVKIKCEGYTNVRSSKDAPAGDDSKIDKADIPF